MPDMETKLFSIITVCYKAENQIRKTIESVLRQNCRDYEYIIVDGKSPDRTFEIACEYREAFEEKGIRYHLVSEKDTGIYNAMNKGVGFSDGKWLLFLNAGDYLCSEKTLEMVQAQSYPEEPDFIYGDVIFEREGQYRYNPCEELSVFDELKYRMPFSHQSIFMARHIFDVHQYNEKYRMCADHELFLKCYLEGRKWRYIPKPISVFEIGGFSSAAGQMYFLKNEVLHISCEQGVISPFRMKQKLFEMKLKKCAHWLIEKVLPASVLEKRKERILEKRMSDDKIAGWSEEFPVIDYDRE